MFSNFIYYFLQGWLKWHKTEKRSQNFVRKVLSTAIFPSLVKSPQTHLKMMQILFCFSSWLDMIINACFTNLFDIKCNLFCDSFVIPVLGVITHLLAANFSAAAFTYSFFAYIFYCIIGTMFCGQAAIGFNRYINVCHFKKPPFKFTRNVNILVVLIVRLFPALIFLLPLTKVWGILEFDPGSGTCTIEDGQSMGNPRRVLFAIGLGVPILLIFYCYFMIYFTFRRSKKQLEKSSTNSTQTPKYRSTFFDADESHVSGEHPETQSPDGTRSFCDEMNTTLRERESRRNRQERRLTVTLFTTFIAFSFCSIPPAVILILDPDATRYPDLHIPMYTFGWLLSIVNPIIYIVLNEAYKQSLKETLMVALFCVKWKSSST